MCVGEANVVESKQQRVSGDDQASPSPVASARQRVLTATLVARPVYFTLHTLISSFSSFPTHRPRLNATTGLITTAKSGAACGFARLLFFVRRARFLPPACCACCVDTPKGPDSKNEQSRQWPAARLTAGGVRDGPRYVSLEGWCLMMWRAGRVSGGREGGRLEGRRNKLQ